MFDADSEANCENAPRRRPVATPAELAEVAAACADAGRALGAAADAAERFEVPPEAILKTQRDAELGLFAGDGVGTPYGEAEVESLRALADHRDPATAARVREIVSAWPAWRAALTADRDEAADTALDSAADRYEALVACLLAMPARTLDDVVAKARAFASMLGDESALAQRLEAEFKAFGPNPAVLALALAHDLVRVADPLRRDPETS